VSLEQKPLENPKLASQLCSFAVQNGSLQWVLEEDKPFNLIANGSCTSVQRGTEPQTSYSSHETLLQPEPLENSTISKCATEPPILKNIIPLPPPSTVKQLVDHSKKEISKTRLKCLGIAKACSVILNSCNNDSGEAFWQGELLVEDDGRQSSNKTSVNKGPFWMSGELLNLSKRISFVKKQNQESSCCQEARGSEQETMARTILNHVSFERRRITTKTPQIQTVKS